MIHKILIYFIISFLFTGCVSTSLKLDKDDDLIFKYNDKNIIIGKKIENKNTLNFKDLFVEEYVVQKDKKRVIFYDKAYTSLNYEFNFNGLYTILYIFNDAQKYNIIFKQNNFMMIQIKQKNEKYINVLMNFSDTQRLEYAYGFENEEFSEILKQVRGDIATPELEDTSKIEQNPHTNYNDYMVYFAPLIKPFTLNRLR